MLPESMRKAPNQITATDEMFTMNMAIGNSSTIQREARSVTE